MKHKAIQFIVYFIFFLSGSILTSCNEVQVKHQVSVYTYAIDLEITNDKTPQYISKYLLQKFGDSLQMTFDEVGNIRFDYFGNGDEGYEYQIYEHTSNNFFSKWKHIDTLFHFNVENNALKLISKSQLNSEVINSIDCQVVEFKAKDELNIDGLVNQIFYYNPDTLKIDSENFKNFNEFFFSDYLNHSQCLYLKKITEFSDYTLTFTFIKHNKNKTIDKKLFIVPDNIARKQQ